MPRMRALRAFTDASTGALVPKGAEFECRDKDAKRIASKGIAQLVGKNALPRKAEMRSEAETELTKPELAEALEKAKASPAHGRRGRPKIKVEE